MTKLTLLLILLFTFTVQAHEINSDQRDKLIWERGKISDKKMHIGGVLSIIPGYSLGHAYQGRWANDGKDYLFGQLYSIGAIMLGVLTCLPGDQNDSCNFGYPVAVAGFLGFAYFRIGEIVDAWAGVSKHNKRYEELTNEKYKKREQAQFFISPISKNSLALSYRLRF